MHQGREPTSDEPTSGDTLGTITDKNNHRVRVKSTQTNSYTRQGIHPPSCFVFFSLFGVDLTYEGLLHLVLAHIPIYPCTVYHNAWILLAKFDRPIYSITSSMVLYLLLFV
ncbi:hypothetical protein HanRHA438_Chr03g0145871 [Helianthus annuus]|nr:hypothetical protein HanRHA438_Chr03g0145871 [Helianthus annuus]